jgi:hypothetical protein
MKAYRYLGKGEVTREGDECDACSNPWKDHARWEKCSPGQVVPDPAYPAHRRYRRPIENPDIELNQLNEDEYLSEGNQGT